MSKIFYLPDLGEGLPDAEIVEWQVKEGDEVKVDDPLVSMETAKAVVDVPSPENGIIGKLHGQAGDVIETGAALVTFGEPGSQLEQTSETSVQEPVTDTADLDVIAEVTVEDEGARDDSGTVVGAMQTSDEVVSERFSAVGGRKVSPAVRALARKLKVDLNQVTPTGADNVVTKDDVKQAAANPPSVPTPAAAPPTVTPTPAPVAATPAALEVPAAAPSGEWEPIRGTRRSMARIMSESHANVVPTTIMDDADIHAWLPGQDITARLLRGLWAGAQVEPGLNAWYNGDDGVRMIHKGMDVGIAVDTQDGLFVAALRDVHKADRDTIRAGINRLRNNVKDRSIPPEDLKDYTIMLSNFGVFAGRYATPIINPPCVSIIAAGKLRHEAVPVLGGFEVHRIMPLSLTFDHRAATGGEAARFLKAMLDDLALPE